MQDILRLGCCVCYRMGFAETPGEVHHLLDEGHRRIGHLATICLCSPGHHRNGDGRVKTSRHPDKERFERLYGTEEELLEWSRKKVQEMQSMLIGG